MLKETWKVVYELRLLHTKDTNMETQTIAMVFI
jgi:hypothetical protein